MNRRKSPKVKRKRGKQKKKGKTKKRKTIREKPEKKEKKKEESGGSCRVGPFGIDLAFTLCVKYLYLHMYT
jgi:hypothetical protein